MAAVKVGVASVQDSADVLSAPAETAPAFPNAVTALEIAGALLAAALLPSTRTRAHSTSIADLVTG